MKHQSIRCLLQSVFALLFLFLLLLNSSCITRHLPPEKVLLAGVDEIEIDNRDIEQDDLENYIRQRPNRKVFGIRFYLQVYNVINKGEAINCPARDDSREQARKEKRAEIKAQPTRRLRRQTRRRLRYNKRSVNSAGVRLKTNIKRRWYNTKVRWCELRKWAQETIGEPPVVYDKDKAAKSKRQIKLYLKNKGYYYAEVDHELFCGAKRTRKFFKKKYGEDCYKKRQKVWVHYTVQTGLPYKVDSLALAIEDTAIAVWFDSTRQESLIDTGILLDVDILQKERDRITKVLRNKGYYYFTPDYVYFKADTIREGDGYYPVYLTMGIKRFRRNMPDGGYRNTVHQKYYLNNIYIYTDYNPKQALHNPTQYRTTLKEDSINGLYYRYSDTLNIRPQTITRGLFLQPGSLYRLDNVKSTYSYLTSLRLFKMSDIQFQKPVESSKQIETDSLLDCHVQLTPSVLQSFTIELEGSNSSANYGFAGNLSYSHRSLFRGAENLDVKLKAGIEDQFDVQEDNSNTNFNTREFGIETRIYFPHFIPFRIKKFDNPNTPKTSISLAFNYQNRPDYTRTISNLSYGYYWKSSKFLSHFFNPIEFSLVRLTDAEEFLQRIEGLYISQSYQDHVIPAINYGMIYNDQDLKKSRNFLYLRNSIETAGNAFYGLTESSGKELKQDKFYSNYSQYIKMDIDFRYYRLLFTKNKMVYRTFLGIGYPYGNSSALPFGKKYYSGGANSLRAFKVRSVGPGTYQSEVDSIGTKLIYNQTADIKLEFNIEYRFRMFWMIEGACFVDAGNIWAINKEDDRLGALFAWHSFYKELFVGTGLGFRFDFDFFVFRLDIGLPLYDPRLETPGALPFNSLDKGMEFNFGIGYPF